jgi:hypothetical protein
MADTLELTGTVDENGQIVLPKTMRAQMVQLFRGKPNAKTHIVVTVKRRRKQRSSPQNRYYRGVLLPHLLRALIEAGNNFLIEGNAEDLEYLHNWMKELHLRNGIDVVDANGVTHTLPPSTTRNSPLEQEEYHERIRQWTAENLNYTIPLPNEQAELW